MFVLFYKATIVIVEIEKIHQKLAEVTQTVCARWIVRARVNSGKNALSIFIIFRHWLVRPAMDSPRFTLNIFRMLRVRPLTPIENCVFTADAIWWHDNHPILTTRAATKVTPLHKGCVYSEFVNYFGCAKTGINIFLRKSPDAFRQQVNKRLQRLHAKTDDYLLN